MRRRKNRVLKGFTGWGQPYMLINKMNQKVRGNMWDITGTGGKFGEYSHLTRIRYEDETMYFGHTADRAGDERTLKIHHAVDRIERRKWR